MAEQAQREADARSSAPKGQPRTTPVVAPAKTAPAKPVAKVEPKTEETKTQEEIDAEAATKETTETELTDEQVSALEKSAPKAVTQEQTKGKSREEVGTKTEEQQREQERREMERRIEARIRRTARAGQEETRETQKKMQAINEWLENKRKMEEERVGFCKNISERIKEIAADVDVSNFDTKIGAAIGVLDNAMTNNKEISHQSIEDAKMAFLRSKRSQLEALKVEFAQGWSFSLTGVSGKQAVVDKFKRISLSRD